MNIILNEKKLANLVNLLIFAFDNDEKIAYQGAPYERYFNIDSIAKFKVLKELWKLGCLHRSDLEDFIMHPTEGMIPAKDKYSDHVQTGLLMNKLIS